MISNFNKMKQHIFTKGGLLLIFLSVFLSFFACQHDVISIAPKSTSSAIKVKEAQQWFDSQNFEDAKTVNLQVQWENATVYGKRVEVPILLDGKRVSKSLVRNDTNYLSKTRLVLYKKNATDYYSYILYFAPSKDFKGKVNAVNTDNYAVKKFDGVVFIANLGNKIIGKYAVLNGERGKYAQLVEPSRDGVKLRDWECIYESDYICAEGWGTEIDPVTGKLIFVKKWVCEPAMVEHCYWVGGDPCNGPNPPSWCDNSDPCNQPVPPPSCSNGDPCDGPNPPLYCNGNGDGNCLTGDCDDVCTSCTQSYGERVITTVDFQIFDISNPDIYLTLGDVTFSQSLSGVNCKTGSIGSKTIKAFNNIFLPLSTVTRANEYSDVVSTEKINPRNPDCGSRIFMQSGGDVTLYTFSGPWSGIPYSKQWFGVKTFVFD
jgi:hypothetical protein